MHQKHGYTTYLSKTSKDNQQFYQMTRIGMILDRMLLALSSVINHESQMYIKKITYRQQSLECFKKRSLQYNIENISMNSRKKKIDNADN